MATNDSPLSVAPSRSLALELGQAGGEPDPISGFSAQSGFTLSDNGDGTLSVEDSQLRLGEKPNGALPVYFIDFGSGQDQPHPTLSRLQTSLTWAGQCQISQDIAKAGSTSSMVIDSAQADGDNSVFAGQGDSTLVLPETNSGGKYFRYYDVYNDFTYSDLAANIQSNTPTSGPNLKTHRWQSQGAQNTPYMGVTMQGSGYRFDFGANDGRSIYDSQMYNLSTYLTELKWSVEEEYHRVSSSQDAYDAVIYGVLNGKQSFVRDSVRSQAGYDPQSSEARWQHYKLANFRYWAAPGVAPWRANVLYIDDSWCRVYITDKATWNTAEQKAMEIQVPTNWLASALTFHKRNGQFSSLSGKYLWVVDNDDNKILVGGWV